jgi:hypothetical protein
VLSLGLHVACAVLLALVLRRLAVPGAVAAGLLFALHPLQVGTVAWISKLTTTLSTAIALGAVLLVLPLLPLDPAAPLLTFTRRQWARYAAAVAVFLLAMLSKTAVAPVAVVLWLLVWWKRGHVEGELSLTLAPFFFIAAGLGWVTSFLEGTLYRVDGARFDWGLGDRLLIAGQAVCFYLGKLVWPWPTSFVYPRWDLSAADPKQLAAVAVMVGLPLAIFRWRDRIGRGPVAAVLMGGALLFPALGFFKVWYMRYSFVADHWAYDGALALLPLGVAGVALGLARLPAAVARVAGVAAVLAVAGVYAALDHERMPHFLNEEATWADALGKAPRSDLAVTNLGWEWVKQGRFDDALTLFTRGVREHPDEPRLQLNAGFCFMRLGAYPESIEMLERAQQLPDLDGKTAEKIEGVLRLARALGRASPEERESLLQRASELVEAKKAAPSALVPRAPSPSGEGPPPRTSSDPPQGG